MIKSRVAKEAIVRMNNQPGVMARVTQNLANRGVNIEAVIAIVEGSETVVRLVTNDHQRTVNILREQQLDPQETKVVVVEALHRPGLLQHITERLAREKIDLYYLYATAADVDRCLVVFSSANNDWAAMVLNG